jgi:urease accessory protein
MIEIPTARVLLHDAPEAPPADKVVLRHSDRAIRLRQLDTVQGLSFIVELPQRTQLDGLYGFQLEDGRVIQIIAEPEKLLEIRGDLTRYVWHIGCLQQQCQIEKDRILIIDHPEMERLMRALGAEITPVTEPFLAEPPVRLEHQHGATCGPDCHHEARQTQGSGADAPATKNGPF